MTSNYDSQQSEWMHQEDACRKRLRRRVWSEIRTILNWMLLLAVLVLGIWVLILKMTYEPGVHVHIINKTGTKLRDVKLTFSWCELSFKELPAIRESWLRPYGGIIQRTGYVEGTHITITWLDAENKPQTFKKSELYLGCSSPLIIISIHNDGTVSVEDRMQGWG